MTLRRRLRLAVDDARVTLCCMYLRLRLRYVRLRIRWLVWRAWRIAGRNDQ